MKTKGSWRLALFGRKALGLALVALLLAIDKVRQASLQNLVSHCEATIAQSALATLLETKLAM